MTKKKELFESSDKSTYEILKEMLDNSIGTAGNVLNYYYTDPEVFDLMVPKSSDIVKNDYYRKAMAKSYSDHVYIVDRIEKRIIEDDATGKKNVIENDASGFRMLKSINDINKDSINFKKFNIKVKYFCCECGYYTTIEIECSYADTVTDKVFKNYLTNYFKQQ